MKKRIFIILCILVSLCITACGRTEAPKEKIKVDLLPEKKEKQDRDTMYQVSTMAALEEGGFDGIITAGEMNNYGNTGIGAFEGMDGELIFINTMVYKADSKGFTRVVQNDEKISFAQSTFFEEDTRIGLEEIKDMEALLKELNKVVEENGSDMFYVVKIIGQFTYVNVCSQNKQEKPYKTLEEALAEDRVEIDFGEMYGTMVGIYDPGNRGDGSEQGWQFHFITGDGARGGRVLNAGIKEAEAHFDITDKFETVPLKEAE